MIRTQVSLTDAQMARLRAESLRQGVSLAQLVRDAIDRSVRGPEWDSRRAAALAAIGAITGDVTDVAQRHDAYLADAYAG